MSSRVVLLRPGSVEIHDNHHPKPSTINYAQFPLTATCRDCGTPIIQRGQDSGWETSQ
jgi:hypothetical protein